MNSPIETSIKQALKLKSHKPSRRVNKTMSGLVRNVTLANKADFSHLDAVALSTIRSVSSSTEYELEKYWAQKIARAKNSQKALQHFPYQANYAMLVERELKLIKNSGFSINAGSSILVVGSGPLPLTYIELAKQSHSTIELVDSSPEAIQLSEAFCKSIQLNTTHHLGDAETIVLEKQYDVILLAALVGNTFNEKQTIVSNLQKYLKASGVLVARSAINSRTLLYPQITEDFTGLKRIAEYHPTDEVINSVLLYKKENNEK